MCGWVQGLPEAGIDGGGLFREFLQEAIKEAFRQFRPVFFLVLHCLHHCLHPTQESVHIDVT